MEKKFEVSEKNKGAIEEFIKDDREPNTNIKPSTLRHDRYCLRKFADFLGEKDIRTTTEKDLKEFFKAIRDFSGYNQVAIKIIIFYRWIDKIDKKEMPERMKWFNFEKRKEKDAEQVKMELISPDEYEQIINACNQDAFGMWKACYETFYQSGGRLGEVASMKVKDVRFGDGRCSLYLRESKTKTRPVACEDYPYYLERWCHNHPFKDDPDAPLWVSTATSHFGQQIHGPSMIVSFWKLRKKISIKQSLSIHNFRKTRATIMFNKRAKDGGLIYSDKQMALFFGWKEHTVALRRREYDLTDSSDLMETVFNQKPKPKDDYDIVKAERDRLEKKHEKEIESLKQQLADVQKTLQEYVIDMSKAVPGPHGTFNVSDQQKQFKIK